MKPPVEIDPEVSLNIKALTILWCDHPRETPNADKIAESLVALPEEMPERTPERRHNKPVEQMPDGTWKKQGYSRRRLEQNLADPSFPINSLLPK